MQMYQIFDFARLPTISHIIWDIDGTITDENGQVNQEVAAKIIRLGLNGIYHSFITGRDAEWVIGKVIEPMKKFFSFSQVIDNFIFFAEVGCVMIDVDSSGKISKKTDPIVEDCSLATNQGGIRDILKNLAYHPNPDNDRYYSGRKLGSTEVVVYDANDDAWVVDRSKEKAPKCFEYIWSLHKEVFATLEKLRDSRGRVGTFIQDTFEATVKEAIKKAGLAKQIDVEVVSTAINIVPKIKGVKFGKAWAAGKALEYVWKVKLGKQPVFDTVVDRTVAAGDGKSDLEFTRPTFSPEIQKELKRSILPIIFVGAKTDLPVGAKTPEGAIKNNIIIQGTGRGNLSFDEPADVICFERAKGARVVNAALNFLNEWGYFHSFY